MFDWIQLIFEETTKSQFYQHFMNSFFANIILPNNFKVKL